MNLLRNNLETGVLVLTLFLVFVITHQAPPHESKVWPSKIVGGTIAAKNELPYQASLKYIGNHFCGGIIINEHYALTAAHCAMYLSQFRVDLDKITVVGGEFSLDANDGTEQERGVQSFYIHENYDSKTQVNDIAVFKLAQPFEFNEAVHAIPIAPAGHQASGNALISGWGIQFGHLYLSEFLYKVTVPIVSDEQCRQAYRVIERNITDNMICAGYDDGGKDSCQGDSGGPFVAFDLGYAYLAGIVSWGKGCALPAFPGVYAEISHYHEWIVQNTNRSVV